MRPRKQYLTMWNVRIEKLQLPLGSNPHFWGAKLLGWILMTTLALCSCTIVQTVSTPTAPPKPPTHTPTFVFPSMVPSTTYTPEQNPTTTPSPLNGLGEALYQDDFDLNSGWEIGASEIGGASLINGRLSLAIRRPNAFLFVRSPAPRVTDFFLEAILRSELCTDGDEFGVAFRINDQAEHYRFGLTCDGNARVSRVLAEGEIALVPLTQTYVVVPGLMVDNRIGVWASGNTFRFFINEAEVFSARDNALRSGDTGLYVRSRRGGQTSVSFDSIILRTLLPTPTPGASSMTPTITEAPHG
jgi:hypothetical protein